MRATGFGWALTVCRARGVRDGVKAPPLTRSGCPDRAATSLAASFNTGTVATTAPTGPSPLLGKTARHLGLAVGPRRESGVLTGYALVWVVSA
jgi:hypothetical protein